MRGEWGLCKDCRWWGKWVGEIHRFAGDPPPHHVCDLLSEAGERAGNEGPGRIETEMVWAEPGVGDPPVFIYTAPDFGCNQFQEKPNAQ